MDCTPTSTCTKSFESPLSPTPFPARITAVLYLVLGGLGLIGAIAAGDPLLGVDAAISVGLGALLYVGAAKRNRVMVQVFLVVTVIFLVLMAVAAVLLVAGASVVSSVAIRGVAENEDVDEGQRAAAAGAAAGIVLFFAMVIFAAIGG